LNATISGKTDQVSLAHNGSRIVGAKRLFLISTSCVKDLEATLSFQVLHWLQNLGSSKASFGAKVV